jgi:hypothetical protein
VPGQIHPRSESQNDRSDYYEQNRHVSTHRGYGIMLANSPAVTCGKTSTANTTIAAITKTAMLTGLGR